MNDQAEKHCAIWFEASRTKNEGKTTRIITVTSGKGGVGKSNFSLNFASITQ